ncbi:peptidase M14 [Amycolatopsis sp. K13G38]|uniref:Peptidase M14 n=1 Tax=Amycolatopsis acididurans TaxID=2724524 RepID=A0ABX1IV77_9PSEU|nr:M14 family zinc carboxypeptidase [Amycolatopsis acididurans]NKQ51398.1 peptidase M14 [Amycolatopsis acididurans]
MFERIMALAGSIPPVERFAGVDELLAQAGQIARQYPELTRWHRIGSSKLGEPLWSLTISGGPRRILVVAAVHPNEPVGGLTSIRLARTLTENDALREELGCTWHIIPCIDPDGTRLNEGWFTPPLTLGSYGRSFYRPAPGEQVEWSFPFAYKENFFDRVMPETIALMRVIDETKPALLCSLHNGEYGGVYYYLSDTTDALNEQLAAIPVRLGLPLHTGEPEAAFIEQIAPAIFRGFTAEQECDFMEELGLDAGRRKAGTSSGAYAARYGTRYLAAEVPYWASPDADDHTPLAMSYPELLAERGERFEETARTLTGLLESVRPDLSVRSPYLRASEAFIPFLWDAAESSRTLAGRQDNDRPAVVAERFHAIGSVLSGRVRFGGMLLNVLGGELAIGNGTPAIRAAHQRLSEVFEGWIAEDPQQRQEIPLAKLVGVQLGAILATTVALAGGRADA